MPFTLSHAAAAWPFRRTRLATSALIFGCFAPDAEYFLRVAPQDDFGHTPAGIFLFSLPIGVAAFLLFRFLVKRPLYLLLPAGFRARAVDWLRPLPRLSVANAVLAVASVLTGILTHVFWDSFTHPRGWFFHHVWWLRHYVRYPLVGAMPGVELLQDLSTVAGGLALLWWLRDWYRKMPPRITPQPSGAAVWAARLTIPPAALAGAIWRAGMVSETLPRAEENNLWLVFFVVAGISYTGLGVILWSLICRLFLRRMLDARAPVRGE